VSKLPRLTGLELVSALKKAGFEIARQKGSHVQMRKFMPDGRKAAFPVPVHTGRILKTGTQKGILRLAGISTDELIDLLK